MSKKLTHDEYTVGWICSLEVKQIAALVMLDEEHERLPQAPSDHNLYNLGSIAGHNVVIAGLHQPGNNSAATVVTQMRMTFSNLRFGLLVGIGGGVPVKTDNGIIRLGDVVVSKPAGEHSGTVQYDYGKARAGQFKQTGALAPPPAVLLNAAQDLAAKRARSPKDPVEDNIKRVDIRIRGLRKYKHPGAVQDHLYRPDYIHLKPEVSCDECGCNPSQRVQRPTDEEDDELYIVVHRGTIASGELVVKDAILRDELAKEYGLLCFETEAAGAPADFPCIVIRGISDYCDSHKNNQWHGYAAVAAAAYARQLFFHMPIDEVKRYVFAKVEEDIQYAKVRQDNQDRCEILDWLTPIDYGPLQSDYLKRRQSGTGQWFLSSTEYQTWLNTDKQTLFCPGIPGAGKTILTSIVIDDLSTRFSANQNVGLAYLYCSFQQRGDQTAEDLLAGLIKQLSQKQLSLPAVVNDLYSQHKDKRTRPSLNGILKALQSVVAIYSRIFVIIDALDECQASDDSHRLFLCSIFNLQVQAHVNIFATSRFISEIELQFAGCIQKEIWAHNNDILRYLNGRIPQLLQSQISKYHDLQDLIRKEVAKAVDGMFLLAQLHMDSLMSKPTAGDIKLALQYLPKGMKGLDTTYLQAMERINGQGEGFRELAKQVLSWLIHARRVLNATELQNALAVRIDIKELDKDFVPEVEVLLSICAGLVTVGENNIIRLVHYTTQEYFERTWASWFPNAQIYITKTCVTYLSFDKFETDFYLKDKEFEERLQLNPLYDYAAQNWGHHARAASAEVENLKLEQSKLKELEVLILNLLKNEAKVSSCSQAMMASVFHYNLEHPTQMTGVHLAAYFGLSKATTALLKNGHDPDSKDSNNRTALSWAAENGHKEVVKQLLNKDGIDLNFKDNYGQTALWWAAGNGHEAVVKQLLEMGAENSNNLI